MNQKFQDPAQILKRIPKGIFLGAKEIPPGGWRSVANSFGINNEYHYNPNKFSNLDDNSPKSNHKNIPHGIFLGAKEIPPGGWRAESDVYRTEDGDQYYEFEFHDVGDNYEVDIVSTPSYGGRDTDGHSRHVLPSDRGGERICFADDSSVRSLSDAKRYASAWAENTSDYIKYGDRF